MLSVGFKPASGLNSTGFGGASGYGNSTNAGAESGNKTFAFGVTSSTSANTSRFLTVYLQLSHAFDKKILVVNTP